jgi:hypothetical protein
MEFSTSYTDIQRDFEAAGFAISVRLARVLLGVGAYTPDQAREELQTRPAKKWLSEPKMGMHTYRELCEIFGHPCTLEGAVTQKSPARATPKAVQGKGLNPALRVEAEEMGRIMARSFFAELVEMKVLNHARVQNAL